VHDFVRKRLKLSNAKTRDRYDRISVRDEFVPGEPVWIYQPRLPRGRSPKFRKPWTGPYKVVERLTDVVYRVQLSPRSRPMTVNRYRMWRCTVQLPTDWFSTVRADGRADTATTDSVDTAAAAAAAAASAADDELDDDTVPYAYRSNTVSDRDEDVGRRVYRETISRDVPDTGQLQQPRTRSGRIIRPPLRFI
jgi:hypothetical protein